MSDAVERHLEVTRTARYWELGGALKNPAEMWYVIHGYKQLAGRFIRRFAAINDGTRRILAPEALSRFYISAEPGRHGPGSFVGATWMTREDRQNEIRDYVDYLERLRTERGHSSASVTVLGFSQGVATAARWVEMGQVRPARLILWGDTLPPDWDHARASKVLANTELILVRGDSDPALTDALRARELEQLERAGVAFRIVRYAGGHDIDGATLTEIASGG